VLVTARTQRPRAVPGIPSHGLVTENVVVEIRADPKRPGGRLVLQDGVESSYIDILDPTHIEFEYLRHLARVVDTVHPKRLPMAMAQIGGGPCVLARYLDATRRDLRALVIERDPEVIAIAREWLALETSARLEVRVADGRDEVARLAPASLDLLVVDAFDGVIVPHHLTTIEFVEMAHAALRPGALHIVNLIDIPPFGYATGIVATLRERYEDVVLLSDRATLEDEASGNLVVVASDAELPVERLARLARLDHDPWDVLWGRRLDRLVAGAAALVDDVAPAHALAMLGPLWGRSRDARTGAGR
jgi:predicted O-methyltransferase YrrM